MKHASGFLGLVEEVMPRVTEISASDIGPQHIAVDVREDGEWVMGHVPGAIHLGRGIIERDIEKTIPDKAANIVLYCGGGYRSALAADSIQKMGYSNVKSLKGGWRAWNEKGAPKP